MYTHLVICVHKYLDEIELPFTARARNDIWETSLLSNHEYDQDNYNLAVTSTVHNHIIYEQARKKDFHLRG